MKLQLSQKRLAAALKKTTQAIGNAKISLPVLNSIRIEAKEGLILAATDLSISIQVGIKPDELKIEEGGCWAVPGKAFEDIVNSLSGDLTLACDGKRFLVRSGHSQFHLNVMPGEDFPNLPSYAGLEFQKFPKEAFWGAIEQIIGCASRDVARVSICGLRLDAENWAATDGHKLAVVRHGLPVQDAMTLPGDSLGRALKNASDSDHVDFCRQGTQVHILDGDTLTTIRMLEIDYPDYKQVIPKTKVGELSVKREHLLTALNRVTLVTDQQHTVAFDIQNGSLKLSAETNEVGAAKDEIECRLSEGTEPCKMGFNSTYVTSLVQNLKGEIITIQLHGKLAPVAIQEGNLTYVIMPKRV